MSTPSDHPPNDEQPNLAGLAQQLAQAGEGKAFWRSLDELVDTQGFRQWLADEFPGGTLDELQAVSRRQFLKIMAASFALGGAVACRNQPPEQIVPYVREPEQVVPGKPLYFATALLHSGYARGVYAESHTGRPTKIEGNPHHPANLGATDIFAQAEILTLYDPSRSQTTRFRDRISDWGTFTRAMGNPLRDVAQRNGQGLRLLTGQITSPTAARQLRQLLEQFPEARWHAYEPVSEEHIRRGGKIAFGRPVDLVYHFEHVRRIVALDADFMFTDPGRVRYARDFADRRRVRDPGEEDQGVGISKPEQMNRLYALEPTPTLTGANADHHLPMSAGRIGAFARRLAQEFEVPVPGLTDKGDAEGDAGADLDPLIERWVKVIAEDLKAHPGESLVLAGASQPPAVHALVHAINEKLGSVGRTVDTIEPVAVRISRQPEDQPASLEALSEDMEAGEVQSLVMIGVNPVYDAPVDLHFADRLGRVRQTVHLGLYRDETAALCDWHVPMTHELEGWSDARAYDGTATVIQPLIEPLYQGRSVHELLGVLTGMVQPSPQAIVRQTWREHFERGGSGQRGEAGEDFESWWRSALRRGVVPGTESPVVQVRVDHEAVGRALQAQRTTQPAGAPHGRGQGETPFEIYFLPDASIWDGRYANNGWLQELAKPMTKITWDNVAKLSPATATRLGIDNERMIRLRYGGRELEAAAWVMPGQADETIAISLGYGRWQAGHVGSGLGFNAYELRRSDALWFDHGLAIEKLDRTYPIATTQNHHVMEGRDLVRTGTIEEFGVDPHKPAEVPGEPGVHRSLYPEYRYEGQQWGMTIDLSTCIGCNACTIACQAENNIPIVGKQGVQRGREMHWIRVDRYFSGQPAQPEIHHQPVPCMHCEKAPCEVVCPVAATKHSDDGLNEMIYNRCIGTRYCSNNCPYKVRRFNFFDYIDDDIQSEQAMRNPEVTVRGRGVMEKCTYCVQRIRTAGITAKNEDRKIYDHEVQTACQQVCPTNAIIFGDINDPDTLVSYTKRQSHQYGLLTELNTQPRTTYLASVRNPNPKLPSVSPPPGSLSSAETAPAPPTMTRPAAAPSETSPVELRISATRSASVTRRRLEPRAKRPDPQP